MPKFLTLFTAGFVLVGCASSPEVLTPSSSTQPETTLHTPRFDDDFYERVEQAAGGVLTGYFAASDEVTQDGGKDPSRMTAWVSPAWLPHELEGFSYFLENQERTIGESRWDSPVVQLARVTPDNTFDVGVMVCVDTQAVMVLPEDAVDPPDIVLAWHPHYDDFTGTDEEWAAIEEYFADVPVRVGDRRTIVFWLVGDTLDRLVVDSSEEWWGANQCLV
jgi:hypothetical protein